MYVTNEMYKQSYKEVITLLMFLPVKDIAKIPKEKLEYYYDNMDKEYNYTIEPNKCLSEQTMSEVTKAILHNIYRNYFATEEEKFKIIEKEKQQLIQKEEEKREKYNPDNLFKNNSILEQEIKNEVTNNSIQMIEYKENILQKLLNKIKKFFHK